MVLESTEGLSGDDSSLIEVLKVEPVLILQWVNLS